MTTLGIIVLVIISVLAGFFIHSVIYHAREEVKAGQPAPAFTGELLDGSRITQADWNRTPRPLLLCFVSPRCNACRRLAPYLNRLSRKYAKAELNILLMGLGGTHDDFVKWKNALDIDLPIAVDVEGTDKLRYAVYSLPAIFLISAGGIVEEIRTGFKEGDQRKFESLFQKYTGGYSGGGIKP